MMLPIIWLAVSALVALVLGFQSWRLTSSGKVRLNTLVGTAGLGYASYLAAHPGGAAKAAGAAFIVAMLFGGYAIGLFLRRRRDPLLRQPAILMSIVAAAALIGSALTWFNL